MLLKDRERPAPAFLIGAYAAVSFLVVLPSLRLWIAPHLSVVAHEFDYFAGLFADAPRALVPAYLVYGRLVHFALFGLAGALFWLLVRELRERPLPPGRRELAAWFLVVPAVFLSAVPTFSIDVFYYVAKGWLESHFGWSPYGAAIARAPFFWQDPMLRNVYPEFAFHAGANYGPAFFKVAAAVSGLSAGSDKAALVLWKVVALACHAGATALVFRLAPARVRVPAAFAYALNPVSLYSFLAAAHNDVLMNVLVLLALLQLREGRGAAAGAFLGTAAAVKYVPLLFLPFFVGAVVPWSREALRGKGLRPAIAVGGAFAATFSAWHLLYPERFSGLLAASEGSPGLRSSLFYLILAVRRAPEWVPPAWLVAAASGAFALAFLAVSGRFAWNRWKGRLAFGLEEACVVAVIAYMLVASRANHEWYLSWALGFCFVAPDGAFGDFGVRVTSLYMPLVIFTALNPLPFLLVSNSVVYLLLLGCSAPLFLHLWRRPVEPDTPELRTPTSGDETARAD